MPKNRELYIAINKLRGTKGISDQDKMAALDAILKVDLKVKSDLSAQEFRNAICAHKAVWEKFDTLMEQGTITSGIFTKTTSPDPQYFEKKDFLDPNDTDTSFYEIVQNAAEERVKLTLLEVDQDVLISILKHNDDECREYLQSKLEPKGVNLTQIAEWNPAPEKLLSDEALERIKRRATNILLLNLLSDDTLMAKPEMQDRKLYEDLVSNDLGRIKDAAKKIVTASGLDLQDLTTDDIVNVLKDPTDLLDDVFEKAKDRNEKLLAQANQVLSDVLSDDRLMAKSELKDPQLYRELMSTDLARMKVAAEKIITASGVDIKGLTPAQVVSAFTKLEDFNEDIITKAKARDEKIIEEVNNVLLKALKDDALMANPVLKDPTLYENLTSPDLTNIKDAIRKIASVPGVDLQGFTVDNVVNAFTKKEDLIGNVGVQANKRHIQIHDELCIAEFNRQCTLVENGIADIDLLAKTALNEEDPKTFLSKLVPLLNEEVDKKYKDRLLALPEDKRQEVGEKVQQRLCSRYLQAKLLQSGVDSIPAFKEILKAKDKNEVITKLKTGLTDHEHVIDHAVTDQNFASFQLTLLKNHIPKMTHPGNLGVLGATDNLKDFKAKLKSVLGTDVDFIQDSDLKDLKRQMREQHFKLIIDNNSRLGGKAHPELMKLYNALPTTKQKDLIDNPKKLSSVMESSDPHVLRRYLGDVNVDELVKENSRNSNFKKIQNAAIVEAFANYKSSFKLEQPQIDQINKALETARLDDLSDFGKYKDLIDKIKTASGIGDDPDFYTAFNIKTGGDDFEPSHPKASAIKVQHDFNKDLLAVRSLSGGVLNQKLIDAMLRTYKDKAIDAPAIQEIQNKLKANNNIEDFFTKLEVPPLSQVFKSSLMKEFSPALFRELKTEQKQKEFTAGDHSQQLQIILDTLTELKRFKKDNDNLIDFHKNLVNLDNMKESHELALQGKPRKEILEKKAQYQSLNKECINIVSKLEDNLKEIEMLRLPVPSTADTAMKAKIEAANKELDAQKKLIQDEIEFYTKLAERTAKRLNQIEAALTDSNRQIYTPEGVKIYRQDRESAKKMDKTVADDADEMISNRPARVLTALDSPGPDPDLFKQIGKPSSTEVICFDTSDDLTGRYRAKTGDTTVKEGPVNFKGRFTYDPSPGGSSSGTLKGDQVHRPNSGRLEIVQFPKCDDGIECEGKLLAEARVEFAMKMVMQELVKRLNNNNPPSLENPITIVSIKGKEDEAKHLWAACVAYGISPDAILVKGNSGFNPNSEVNRGRFSKTSVKEDSFYKKEFEIYATPIKTHVDAYKTKVQEKADAEKATKGVDKDLNKVMNKQQFTDLREEGKRKEEQRSQQQAPEEVSSEVARLQGPTGG